MTTRLAVCLGLRMKRFHEQLSLHITPDRVADGRAVRRRASILGWAGLYFPMHNKVRTRAELCYHAD